MKRLLPRILFMCGVLSGQAAWGYVVHVVQQVEVDGVIVETIDKTHDAPVMLATSRAGSRSGSTFTHWSTSTAQDFVGRDSWGRAYEQVSFTVYEPMTNTAHYVREDRDDDGDGMPDGVELYWYGNLDQTRDSDTDGDGLGFALELELGFNPHFADEWRSGVRCLSARLPSHRISIKCDPPNVLFADYSVDAVENAFFTSPKFDPHTTHFFHWLKGDEIQEGEQGEPLEEVSFQMPACDVELVAVCKTYRLIRRCEPEGMLFATTTNWLVRGEMVSTTAYNSRSSNFAYWKLDGERQTDDFGRAVDALSFEMPAQEVDILAVCSEDEMTRESLYWYGVAEIGENSDTDGDGYTLSQERMLGLNPLFKDESVGGLKTTSCKPKFFKYTVRSEPEGRLFATTVEDVCPGVVKTTAAYSPKSSQFAYWTVAGRAVRDDFGRALDVSSLEMPTNDIEVVAHCAESEEARQALYWYGDESKGWTSDTDGDGLTLKEEVSLGLNPLFADVWERGILSAVKGFELFSCIIRSEPEGALFATQRMNLGPGVSVATPTCDEKTTGFASWYLNGVRQADEFGRAWNAITFAMPPTNTEVVATTRDDAEARNALYWYGDADVSPDSDTDGDGLTLADERLLGTNPLFADTEQHRGVRFALSEELEADLQPHERLTGVVLDERFEEVFYSPGAKNGETCRTFGEGITPYVADVNGDGRWDVVLRDAAGTVTVWVNTGSPGNPQFSVQALALPGFAWDANAVSRAAALSLDTPILAGLSATYGDVNGDGATDILASDTAGRIWYYRNDASAQVPMEEASFTLQYKVWGGTHAGFAEGLRIAAVDWDDDGDLDCLAGTVGGKLMLLRDPKVGRPTNLRAAAGFDSVVLDWDPNAQSRIRGYRVYRKDANDGKDESDAASWSPLSFTSFESFMSFTTPLPTYRDLPPSLADYGYAVSSVSRFYTAGNSTPIVSESPKTEAIRVSFGKVSLHWNDVATKQGETFKLMLSIDNSMNLSPDGMVIEIEYDHAVLNLLKRVESGLFEDGKIAPGGGKLYEYVFEVVDGAAGLDGEDAVATQVSVKSATMYAMRNDGASPSYPVAVALPEKNAVVTIAARTESAPYQLGDVTGDGVVDTLDLRELAKLKSAAGRKWTANQLKAGDFNGNGKLDNADYQALRELLKEKGQL